MILFLFLVIYSWNFQNVSASFYITRKKIQFDPTKDKEFPHRTLLCIHVYNMYPCLTLQKCTIFIKGVYGEIYFFRIQLKLFSGYIHAKIKQSPLIFIYMKACVQLRLCRSWQWSDKKNIENVGAEGAVENIGYRWKGDYTRIGLTYNTTRFFFINKIYLQKNTNLLFTFNPIRNRNFVSSVKNLPYGGTNSISLDQLSSQVFDSKRDKATEMLSVHVHEQQIW